ncbi:MAG: single-stranded-DNA-specific exonuclease [Rhodospirillaceae bacterium]|nr:MAG: single-stranded-DNA-specific exonuclease [Rhodospirillaceae bacterium]
MQPVEAHLTPTLRHYLPDPFHLKDMDRAAARLSKAIMGAETIAVFGDYDVDGATSAALMKRFIEAAGGRAILYVPDRIDEGYGPNTAALLKLREEGARVVVTVDCGTSAFDPLAAAATAGLDVVVVDHHKAEHHLPQAVAVVNPNRVDETSPHGHLAAVGVAFLVTVATNRALRESGWYLQDRTAPDPMQWLDLVALGTICDMVPLTGVNRAMVTQGLKVMARRGNAGLNALAEVAGMQERPDAWHLGFLLGPRVNAGGRVGQADLGARLLSTHDPEEALTLARLLDGHNHDRQEIEGQVLLAVMEQIEEQAKTPMIFVAGRQWHPGVIGIVAGRLKERYNRPACVFAVDGDVAKGSGRSVPGIDLGAAVLAARAEGLLEAGGGHAMAAGFTVRLENLLAFRDFLVEHLLTTDVSEVTPTLRLEGAMEPAGATLSLVQSLRQLGPFGSGNPEPRFALANVRVVRPEVVGMGHVRCMLVGTTGSRLKAIAFRSADSDLGYALLANNGTLMHVAGTLHHDVWQGRNEVQLFIEDAAYAR